MPACLPFFFLLQIHPPQSFFKFCLFLEISFLIVPAVLLVLSHVTAKLLNLIQSRRMTPLTWQSSSCMKSRDFVESKDPDWTFVQVLPSMQALDSLSFYFQVGQVSGLIRRRRRAVIFARPGAGRTDAGKHSTAFGSGFSISRGRRKGSLFRTAARQRWSPEARAAPAEDMAAFIAKQMVGDQLKSVKGKFC